MITKVRLALIALFISALSIQSQSQDISFEDFVGTWQGTYTSEFSNIYDLPITMTIEPDGFYTETTGIFMPTLYPNTQQSEYDAATNRYHWWYLNLVYSGQYFYQHFYYEVVSFDGNTIELHYNFWDDPTPNPSAGILILVKEGSTPPPVNIMPGFVDDEIFLLWDEPVAGGTTPEGLQGYNVYRSIDGGNYELLGFTEETAFPLTDQANAGVNSFYVTAVYDSGESEPSDEAFMVFDTPEPTNLAGTSESQDIFLEWDEPYSEMGFRATLLGYNIFHKYDNNPYELAAFVESTNFLHENLAQGIHSYYITAVYLGGESDPSDEIAVTLITTGINEAQSASTLVYPNPAREFVLINAETDINRIQVMNQAGQTVVSEGAVAKNHRLDISQLSRGLYIMVLETNDGLISKKLMVE